MHGRAVSYFVVFLPQLFRLLPKNHVFEPRCVTFCPKTDTALSQINDYVHVAEEMGISLAT